MCAGRQREQAAEDFAIGDVRVNEQSVAIQPARGIDGIHAIHVLVIGEVLAMHVLHGRRLQDAKAPDRPSWSCAIKNCAISVAVALSPPAGAIWKYSNSLAELESCVNIVIVFPYETSLDPGQGVLVISAGRQVSDQCLVENVLHTHSLGVSASDVRSRKVQERVYPPVRDVQQWQAEMRIVDQHPVQRRLVDQWLAEE